MKGLIDNQHLLDAITETLLENSRITGLVSYSCELSFGTSHMLISG